MYATYFLYNEIDKADTFTLSFDVINVERPPLGGYFLVLFFHNTKFSRNEYIKYESGKTRYSVTTRITEGTEPQNPYAANRILIYPNNSYINPSTTPNCGYFTIANIKLERGNVATDWTPAPEDLFVALDSAKRELNQTINDGLSKKADTSAVEELGNYVLGSNRNISHEFQLLRAKDKELEAKQMQDDEREFLSYLKLKHFHYNKKDPNTSVHDTLFAMMSDLSLRSPDGTPTAILGGSTSKSRAILLAGVSGYGTTQQAERAAIYEDGSAKFGEVKLSDKTIVLMPQSGLPLRVTAEEGTFIENFLENSKYERDIAYEQSFVVLGKGEARTYSFSVDNNDTKLTITIPKLTSEVYQPSKSVILTLDGVTLGSWRGDSKIVKDDTSGFVGGGVRFRNENAPLVVENVSWERYLNKGSHTLSVSVTSTDTTDKATISKLTAHLYYDASQAETMLTCKGFRAFGGRNRYFDIDTSEKYYYRNLIEYTNKYIARVKGGMRVDSLTLEQPLDAPGCVLAGGRVEWGGQINNSFGKYKNERGKGNPNAYYNSSRKVFVVYHSIGNTKYVPMITSTAGSWADLPQVVAVNSYSFEVAFINGNNERNQWGFNYTCFKAD